MGVSLLTSLALALTWTPNLSQYFIAQARRTTQNRQTRIRGRVDHATAGGRRSSLSGFFLQVVNFHERWLRRALAKPRWLAAMSLALVVMSYVCYRFSGSDLLPEMDEGGFILDYLTPAGIRWPKPTAWSDHVEKIVHSVPEVESTSRRTGLQLGLAAVTEANRGDILVKLKADRKRDIDDIMADIRSQVAAAGTSRQSRSSCRCCRT